MITRPIGKLQTLIKTTNSIEHLDKMTASVYQLDSGLDEFENLHRAYQRMNKELNDSVNDMLLSQSQELQAKMLALQSQMNPHFLYNTLTNISVLIEERMNVKASSMIDNLFVMLRYIAQDSEFVTIQDEINYTEEYLECMEIRFDDALLYKFHLPESMLNIKIPPKLILQPLVENSLKFGGADIDPPYVIDIEGFIEKKLLVYSCKRQRPGLL